MSIQLHNEFEVGRPAAQVWKFLTDPAKVVPCMPGARLLQVIDERSFEGEVGLWLGPLAATLRGIVRFDLLDPDHLTVRMSGEGRNTAGEILARMQMSSHLIPLAAGRTRVDVTQCLRLSGILAVVAELGLLQGATDLVLGRFARRVQQRLEEQRAP